MTIPFDWHFAQRSAGRPAQSAPLMQVPAHVRWALRNLQNWMVRAVGIEPTLLSEPDFESGASTSSTTPATLWSLTQAALDRKSLPGPLLDRVHSPLADVAFVNLPGP